MTFPDGGKHQLYLAKDGWTLNIAGCPVGSLAWASVKEDAKTNALTWYSVDGTYLRLQIQPGENWLATDWVLYLPDGSKVIDNATSGLQSVQDRNGNSVTFGNYLHESSMTTKIQPGALSTLSPPDDSHPAIWISHDVDAAKTTITTKGYSGETLTGAIQWTTVEFVDRMYTCHIGTYLRDCYLGQGFDVVSSVELPRRTQDPARVYTFTHGATWGEVSQMTTPTGTKVEYKYPLDNVTDVTWFQLLGNAPNQKTLTYDREFDGQSAVATETWTYQFNTGDSLITGPDNGVTHHWFPSINYQWGSSPDAGRIFKTTNPDGSIHETVWAPNPPKDYPSTANNPNAFAQAEFDTVPNSANQPARTAARWYGADKNGNRTWSREYDFTAYTGDHTLPPPGALLLRTTTAQYYNATPDSSDYTTDSLNVYNKTGAPTLLAQLKSTEVQGGYTSVESRTEFTYDPNYNLTKETRWDSTKGAYSNPLSGSNSINTSYHYTGHGNRDQVTDARGVMTTFAYNDCGTDLYLSSMTQPVVGTTSYTHDCSTGLLKSTTDPNSATTTTDYDVFGRPTLVSEAGLRTTKVTYNDPGRWVVAHRDRDTNGDGRIVTVHHFDPLERETLTRQYETAPSGSDDQIAADAGGGIKVQKRVFTNAGTNYTLVSNPYREATSQQATAADMGWALESRDPAGRPMSVETFAGAGLPSAWPGGTNSNSTGRTQTGYNADATGKIVTVTDPAGKARASYSAWAG